MHHRVPPTEGRRPKIQCSVSFNDPTSQGAEQAAGRWQQWSLEDLALIEGFAHVLEGPLPGEVLSDQRLCLLVAGVQLPPRVGLIVHLPVGTQLQEARRRQWLGCWPPWGPTCP